MKKNYVSAQLCLRKFCEQDVMTVSSTGVVFGDETVYGTLPGWVSSLVK